MDPINILLGISLIATFGANVSGAKKGFTKTLTNVKIRPKTYLQSFPPNLAVLILVLIILSVFQIGTLDYRKYDYLNSLRYSGLFLHVIFSWLQIWTSKKMGDNYSNEIVITKNHQLITTGPFRVVRHPLYLFQILSDLGASLALLSYIVFPLVLVEIPLLIIRAKFEDKLLAQHFGEQFLAYKKKSGLLVPFIG